jgi:hypothetical protein
MQIMSYQSVVHPKAKAPKHCAQFPELTRMNYFYGQMLGPRDFLAEQAYHRAKHLLINRCLHGYGVVCGLLVALVPTDEPCPDSKDDKRRAIEEKIAAVEAELNKLDAAGTTGERLTELEAELEDLRRQRDALGNAEGYRDHAGHKPKKLKHKLKLTCGLAIDPSGHEIVAGHEATIELDAYLSDSDRERIAQQHCVIYVSICYAECGFEPVRPAAMDACQITPGCQNARIRESYRIAISLERPEADDRCEFCCTGSCDTCVLLAAIHVRSGHPIKPEDVDNSVRRPFGTYAPTVITGINWHHGGIYSPQDAEALLGTGSNQGGLEIRFSRPIHVNSIKPGVVELLSFAGGRGVAGEITHITGRFVDLPPNGMVNRILYRDTTDERPRPGDRILVIVRCDFLLDACCRAVDGNHIGGRVPYIGPENANDDSTDGDEPEPCSMMPGRGGAWTSGNGVAGGSFESWFFIERGKEAVA